MLCLVIIYGMDHQVRELTTHLPGIPMVHRCTVQYHLGLWIDRRQFYAQCLFFLFRVEGAVVVDIDVDWMVVGIMLSPHLLLLALVAVAVVVVTVFMLLLELSGDVVVVVVDDRMENDSTWNTSMPITSSNNMEKRGEEEDDAPTAAVLIGFDFAIFAYSINT